MEMVAVIEGIKHVIDTHECDKILIVSDSGYLVKGWEDPAYLNRWVQNGWITSSKKPVQNKDLWQELIKLSWHIGFNFKHIRGHNKDRDKDHAFWNNIVDMACSKMLEMKQNGFQFVLRYYFESKEFDVVTAKLVDRQKED